MTRTERLATLWVTGHMLLVLLGALELLPTPGKAGSPSHLLTVYTELTGAGTDFSFFSPAVGSEIRVRFRRTDTEGAEEAIQLRTSNREVNARINTMLVSSMRVAELTQPLARSWAALILRSRSDAATVEVVAESYSVPSMSEYRAGRRPVWREIYQAEFEARPRSQTPGVP